MPMPDDPVAIANLETYTWGPNWGLVFSRNHSCPRTLLSRDFGLCAPFNLAIASNCRCWHPSNFSFRMNALGQTFAQSRVASPLHRLAQKLYDPPKSL